MNLKTTHTDATYAASATGDEQNSNEDVRLPISRYVLFFSLLVIGAAADLVSKSWVFARHFDPAIAAERHPQPVALWWVDGMFGLQTSTNPGALFGLGAGYSWLFAAFSVVALTAILVWLFAFGAARERWLTVTLGLISGGIIGNLYDRLGLGSRCKLSSRNPGQRFATGILFRLEGVPLFDPWPNFNIADSLLVGGAIMLLIHAFFMQPASDADQQQPTS